MLIKKPTAAPKRKVSDDDSEEEEEHQPAVKLAPAPELLAFLSEVVSLFAANELALPDEEQQLAEAHSFQYGLCNRPFGVLRTQIVEFLAEFYSASPSP